MYYPVVCQKCGNTVPIETRGFKIAYPLDYENRIRKYFSDHCTKCGGMIDIGPMNGSRRHEKDCNVHYCRNDVDRLCGV